MCLNFLFSVLGGKIANQGNGSVIDPGKRTAETLLGHCPEYWATIDLSLFAPIPYENGVQ